MNDLIDADALIEKYGEWYTEEETMASEGRYAKGIV